jgi:hypothetical protein
VASTLGGDPLDSDAASDEPALPPFDPFHIYRRVRRRDLDDGFWWRTSTDAYIDELAEQPALTIYAGADGHSDVGEPKHEVAVATLLDHALMTDLRDLSPILQKEYRELTSARFAGCSPSYVGSILRGLADLHKIDPTRNEDAMIGELSRLIDPAAEEGRAIKGFVAKAIVNLALAFRDANRPIAISSAHYDDDILAELRFRDKSEPRQLFLSAERPEVIARDGELPILSMHGDPDGRPSGRLVLSEADLFRTADDGDSQACWAKTLELTLRERPALFVGTDIRTPGLVTALANTRDSPHPRCALLLADPAAMFASDPPPSTGDLTPSLVSASSVPLLTATASADVIPDLRAQSLYLNALAARYLHLGVVPIIADFPFQVPQFLREVALRISQGKNDYESYSERSSEWWEANKAALGFETAPGAEQSAALQHDCYRYLRNMLVEIADESGVTADEQLSIEMWVRHPNLRELFLWASSGGYWRPSATGPKASLRVRGDVTQTTFREGRTIRKQLLPESQGKWRYHISMPLILPDEWPWFCLPIGVVNVMSTRDDGGLAALGAEQEPFDADRRKALVALVPATRPTS